MTDNDLSKTIIRIIMDYCFSNSAIYNNDKFALTLSSKIINLRKKEYDFSLFYEEAKKRTDFFVANEINCFEFCKGLYKKLNQELSFYTPTTFFDLIVEFKRKIENGAFRGFPKAKTSEDTLRSTLTIYLDVEAFCEPRSAAGNNDITVPSCKTIVETKLWEGEEYYNSGFPELNEYLEKYNYKTGYYIIFDYNKSINKIMKSNGAIFSTKYCNKDIQVFFIRMNEVRPSEVYKTNKDNKAE